MQKQKPAEKFVTLPSDAEQSTKRQRQEEIPREQSQPGLSASSFFSAADTSMHVPDPHVAKPARPFPPSEKTAFRNVRGPAEGNTVLMIAGVNNGNEIASWTKDQKTRHTAKQKELLNMDKFGVVEVVDGPPSQQVLWTRWVQQQRLDGSYKNANCGTEDLSRLSVLMQTSTQERQSSRLCEVFSPLLQSTEIQWHSEIVTVRFIDHQCRAIQNQCMWSQCLKYRWTLHKVWLRNTALQGLKISPQTWSIQSTDKINVMGFDQLVSEPSTYVKKRTQRQDESILLRHMDDVVGTAPEEHLTRWFLNTLRPIRF